MTQRPQTAARLMFTACAGLFSYGIVIALVGAILPELQRRLGFGLERAGLLQSVLFVGQVPTLLLVGPLIDRVGKKPVLVAGGTLFALPLLGMAYSPGYAALATMLFLLGLGGSCLDVGSSTLIPDSYPANPSPAMNVGNFFFSMGAVFLPLLTLATRRLGLGPSLVFLAAAMALLAAWAALETFPPAAQAGGFDWHEARRVVLHPTVLQLAAVLFLYVSLEVATAAWARTYLEQTFAATARTSTLVLTLFWGAQAAGRLVASRLVRKVRGPSLVLLASCGAVLGALLIAFAPSATIAAAGIAFCGLTYGPIFPTSVATASTHFPALFGTVFGLLTAAGLTGAMILPTAVGYVAKATSLRTGIGLLVVAAVLMLLAQAVYIRSEAQHGPVK